MSRLWLPALAGMTLLACSSDGPVIEQQVLTPPPSAPRAEFFVAKAEVQSREVGNAAWERNETYGRALAEALRSALRDRGKALASPPADTVRAKVYLAYGPAPVKVKDKKKADGYAEIRLQLHDAASGAVVYTTHTMAQIPRFAGDEESDAIIRAALEKAARDFASRL